MDRAVTGANDRLVPIRIRGLGQSANRLHEPSEARKSLFAEQFPSLHSDLDSLYGSPW